MASDRAYFVTFHFWICKWISRVVDTREKRAIIPPHPEGPLRRTWSVRITPAGRLVIEIMAAASAACTRGKTNN